MCSFFFFFIGWMTHVSVAEKKAMIARAKTSRGEVQFVHHSDHVNFQTQVAKKSQNVVKGNVVKVVPLNTVMLLLPLRVMNSSPDKKSVDDYGKMEIYLDGVTSVDLEVDNVMVGSSGILQQGKSFSSHGSGEFHFWDRSSNAL